jgi:transcriptional regulator with XRE-family HTH domain
MAAPNLLLRTARLHLGDSQDDFAARLRAAGLDGVTKRTVQRWEAGQTTTLRPRSAGVLEAVLKLPIESLGFGQVTGDGRGGHDLGFAPNLAAESRPAPNLAARGGYSGVWKSRYEYYSSSRGATFASLHYVVLLHRGDRITVRSLDGSADSQVTMDLTLDGNVVTGSWVEDTDPTGHYRGARYHGALQLLAEPTGRRMVGKWVGFGKEGDVNTGPWTLDFEAAGTDRATLAAYDRPVDG